MDLPRGCLNTALISTGYIMDSAKRIQTTLKTISDYNRLPPPVCHTFILLSPL